MAQATDRGWHTQDFATQDRYEAWRHKLSDVYGAWSVDRAITSDFQAEIRHRAVQNLQVVNCVCDPCGAVRRRSEIGRDGHETLVVQLVHSGREHFTIDSKKAILGPGDVLIWNTTRPMNFEVIERLEKTSVMMPLARLKNWLPHSWHAIGSTLPNGSTGASLLGSFISSMSPAFLAGTLQHAEALTEAMIAMIVSAIDDQARTADFGSLRDAQLLRIKHYIDAHLDDCALSPSMIAEANRISLRYLHALFEPEGTTVLQYIIRKRLLRCRRELANPLMARRTITDIAFSCGFQSSTHFSRRFRDAFGMSPLDFRQETSAQTPEF